MPLDGSAPAVVVFVSQVVGLSALVTRAGSVWEESEAGSWSKSCRISARPRVEEATLPWNMAKGRFAWQGKGAQIKRRIGA
jgi:hypothetical protein